jgi:hypothetical protein
MCWEADPHTRPTFEAIVQGLHETVNTTSSSSEARRADVETHDYHDFTNGCTEVPRRITSAESIESRSRRQSQIEPPANRLSQWNAMDAFPRVALPASSRSHVHQGWTSAPEFPDVKPFPSFGAETPLFMAKVPSRMQTEIPSFRLGTIGEEEPRVTFAPPSGHTPISITTGYFISHVAGDALSAAPRLSQETDV